MRRSSRSTLAQPRARARGPRYRRGIRALTISVVLLTACGSPEPRPSAPAPVVELAAEAEAPECAEPYECVLRPREACMPCGVPELADVRAVGRAGRLAMEREPPPECPACETETNPSLFATCEAGRCVAVDLRQDPLSACAADAECVVTEPDCCACRPGWVAVRRGAEADYFRRQCGETPICSPCERHEVPAHLSARCVEGHCRVAEGPPPACHPTCERVEQDRCQPDGAPCACAYLHQPFADCEPGPDRPCPSARAFYIACDPRCCASESVLTRPGS